MRRKDDIMEAIKEYINSMRFVDQDKKERLIQRIMQVNSKVTKEEMIEDIILTIGLLIMFSKSSIDDERIKEVEGLGNLILRLSV